MRVCQNWALIFSPFTSGFMMIGERQKHRGELITHEFMTLNFAYYMNT